MRARVFISCGQSSDDEKRAATEIKNRLVKELDYDQESFVSIEKTSFESIAHAIFKKIAAYEYFLFIDFKREYIGEENGRTKYRGSLYSHQELALAAFLQKPFIAFREKGVVIEGMSKGWFSNAIEFENKSELVDIVVSSLKSRPDWNSAHRDELSIEIPIGTYLKKDRRNVDKLGSSTFFHIPIKNNSVLEHAVGCGAYVSRCLKLGRTVEDRGTISADLKWTGVSIPHVKLYKKTNSLNNFTRSIAAAFRPDNIPASSNNPHKKGYFYFVGDFMGYPQEYFEIGDYLIEYTIVSDNFPEVKAGFRLRLGEDKDDFSMQRIDNTEIEMALHL